MNYFGDPHPYPYKIYPCRQPLDHGYDAFGVGRAPHMIQRLEPDVVVFLNDPWNIKGYMDEIEKRCDFTSIPRPKFVAWLAVDGENHKGKDLNTLDAVAVWTQFASNQLTSGGCTLNPYIIPLGVDLDVFSPRNREESRARVMPPSEDRDSLYVVGVVGRNQPRKRLDLTLEYFAAWVAYSGRKNARLYLHVGPTGDVGFDLESLIRYNKLQGKVIICRPSIGEGAPPDLMPYVYSAFDAYLCTSQGEGWGLPALEAMACGVPCVLPDFAAFGPDGWVGEAAYRASAPQRVTTAPIDGLQYTVGALPSKEHVVTGLEKIAVSPPYSEHLRLNGILKAQKLQWKFTGEKMVRMLEYVVWGNTITQ